jgi:hypothetical protein
MRWRWRRGGKRPLIVARSIADQKIGTGIHGKIRWAIRFLTRRGSISASPRSSMGNTSSVYDRHRATLSVIAVSGPDRSLVVFREGISQFAGLAW